MLVYFSNFVLCRTENELVINSLLQAFYYMSHQSQSISLLDDTDKQIRERSCTEQVKRLKEARNAYREELVDCVRQCAW